jgi:hypothetical protein
MPCCPHKPLQDLDNAAAMCASYAVQTDGHRVLVQPRAAGTVSGRSTSGRTASGRTLSGRPTSAGQQHGFKANLLFRPLPELDTAVKSG